jgi:hypothetical protein
LTHNKIQTERKNVLFPHHSINQSIRNNENNRFEAVKGHLTNRKGKVVFFAFTGEK